MESLEKLMKDYRKNVQKAKTRAIGRSIVQSKELKKTKTKSLGEKESKTAKASCSKATKGLEANVKGQFGKKITEVFDQQQQALDKF
ncbi:hypothetical protein [Carnobacterium divergens]|uniref:hypothetical protein n=1 Tax=Carnobacterium divergens TaxID=2748 RepID=UPI002890AAE6|nr:hypothetical protein [Carnobacterium divergens]MDT2010831.1 hypothetical protein [Carnobacterium divergens]